MAKPIYLLECKIKADLGFMTEERIEYYYYFESFADAEKEIESFKDKAIRSFKMRWRLDEIDSDFTCDITIKEKHLFEK